MCLHDTRTQAIPFGIGNNLGEIAPGITGGLVVFPGSAQKRTRCAKETKVLTAKVTGIAAHMMLPPALPGGPALPVTNARAVMLAYLADNWTVQQILENTQTPADKIAAYEAFTQILERKFVGGFGDGDAGTREMYATNFGAGFPPGVPAYGGSTTTYAVVIRWEIPTAELGHNMCLIDWGWDISEGVEI